MANGKHFIPDWNPQPGNLDIVIQERGVPIGFAEVKIEKVEECLWDAYKLAAACTREGALAGYLTVAARATTWRSSRDCVELLPAEGESVHFDSQELFQKNWRAWKYLLGGGRGRPARIPRAIEVRGIACLPFTGVPPYELRVAGVRPIGAEWLEFVGDWPVGVAPRSGNRPAQVRDPVLDWLPSRLPSNGAKSDALFASHVPSLTDEHYACLVAELRRRG